MRKEIYFAGGCFWGVEEFFSRIHGIVETEVGYANGRGENPSYEQVCTSDTGFAEVVHVVYDDDIIDLTALTNSFLSIIDPYSVNRQGGDTGTQYRSGIYYVDALDQPLLAAQLQELQGRSDEKVAVELLPLHNYYPAEEYHQDYLKKNPQGYCHIQFD